MRKDDYKQFVTGNLKRGKGKDNPNNGIMAHANSSASAKTNKIMKRDKGH